MTVETLQKAREEYKSMSDYYTGISFPILAGRFQSMVDLCSDMIKLVESFDKFKEESFSKSDVDNAVIKSVSKVRNELLETLDDFYTSGDDAHLETTDLVDDAIKKALGEKGAELIKSFKED